MIRARANKGEKPIAITCFFEELPLPGIGEVSTDVCSVLYVFAVWLSLHDATLVLLDFVQ